MKTAVVIPARYGSMRFPGKVLAMLRGKPIVQWVWECAMKSKADLVLVATDDDRVYKTVESFGGKAVMTSPNHPSGSDRIMEAVKDIDADIIINVQGDEPSMPPELIDHGSCAAPHGIQTVKTVGKSVSNQHITRRKLQKGKTS